jgi:hypothetical protein
MGVDETLWVPESTAPTPPGEFEILKKRTLFHFER